ncbi:hypothetical protein BAU17_00300 [Enterococcus sp. CU12B]|uniref:Transposase n=1 Tax=Candidatus Enterococcus willemsii TaxID=1857215 RepID=A0ABQ6Z285_9ENTE|nr:hypothetical protein BAU17_00300 [Enterococcus sp. CU12B]
MQSIPCSSIVILTEELKNQLKLRWYHAKRRPQENKQSCCFLEDAFFDKVMLQGRIRRIKR